MLKLISWDPHKKLALPGNYDAALSYSTELFVTRAQESIKDHGSFFVALSGGSTPKAIFQRLTSSPYQERVDWKNVHLFWSDERAVSSDNPDSNYHMAMTSGLEKMPIPKDHIHRMQAENNLEENAALYEKTILSVLKNKPFDWIMLGMGDDGHTASLFPHTKALHNVEKLVCPNYIPQKECSRMTLTFKCINQAKEAVLFVFGESKAATLLEVLTEPNQFELFPSQHVGTTHHPALWIIDDAAASLIKQDPRIKG